MYIECCEQSHQVLEYLFKALKDYSLHMASLVNSCLCLSFCLCVCLPVCCPGNYQKANLYQDITAGCLLEVFKKEHLAFNHWCNLRGLKLIKLGGVVNHPFENQAPISSLRN